MATNIRAILPALSVLPIIILFAVNKGMLLSSESSSVVEGSAVNEDLGVSIPMKHYNDRVVTVSFD